MVPPKAVLTIGVPGAHHFALPYPRCGGELGWRGSIHRRIVWGGARTRRHGGNYAVAESSREVAWRLSKLFRPSGQRRSARRTRLGSVFQRL